jgi:hypothetical protein
MLIEKIYSATLDVRDPENYCAHPETYVLTYLNRRYVGRNLGGAQIIKILAVLRRSDCRIKDTDLSAEGYVDVEFRAQVSILARGDIVTGVKIKNRGQQITIGQSEVEGAVVAALDPSAETVRVDQTIPIRVNLVLYSPDQLQASVAGPLLTCDRETPAYLLDQCLQSEDARDMAALAAQIRQLLETRAALAETRHADLHFFEKILYSYSNPPDGAQVVETPSGAAWDGPAGVTLPTGAAAVNLLAVIAEAESKGSADVQGVWCRDLAIYRSAPLAARAPPDAIPPSWKTPKAETPRIAFASMLQTVFLFLKAINEMVTTYDTADMIESHKNIWQTMRGAQVLHPPV